MKHFCFRCNSGCCETVKQIYRCEKAKQIIRCTFVTDVTMYSSFSTRCEQTERTASCFLASSWLMGSIFLRYPRPGLNTVSQPKCDLVNGIIWLMLSVCLGPMVIPLIQL